MLCKLVYPGDFVVWVTCMIKEYEDTIIAGMVRKGYQVGIASVDGNLTTCREGSPSVVVAFTAKTSDEAKEAKDIYSDIVDVLETGKVLYYSVVVSARVDSSWNGSNIQLPKKPVPPPLPVLETDKKLN